MKCVCDKRDLQSYRVNNTDAERKVNSGRYEYISRETWKIQGRRREF